MAKISQYNVLDDIDPQSDLIVLAYNGEDFSLPIGEVSGIANHLRLQKISSDFINTDSSGGTDALAPFFTPGFHSVEDWEDGHPGILNLNNTYLGVGNSWILDIGDRIEAIVKFPSGSNDSFWGLFDGTTSLSSGAWVVFERDSSANRVRGRVRQGVGVTGDGPYHTLAEDTWYRFVIEIETASKTNFYIYDDSGGLLFSDSVICSIPTSGIGNSVVNADSGTDDIHVDYFSIQKSVVLAR